MPSALRVRYVARGDGQIAYGTIGDADGHLLLLTDAFSPIDDFPTLPAADHFLQRLARLRTVVLVNFRGQGLSDPVVDITGYPDANALDVLAVLDDLGVDRTDLVTEGWPGNIALWFAVNHRERVGSLVLCHPVVRAVATDDYAHAPTAEDYQAFEDGLASGVFSATDQLSFIAPSVAHDPDAIEWLDRSMRRGASPIAVRMSFEQGRQQDSRPLLGQVPADVPVLVLHRVDNQFSPLGAGRYVAEHIAGARLVELPGADHVIFLGNTEPVLDEIEEFLTGTRLGRDIERRLLTVLFSDLVDSTGQAAAAGDARWRERLDAHDRTVRSLVARHGGRVVKTTGDGCLATFDGPGPALRAAAAMAAELGARELPARFAVHVGEVEVRGDDIGGIAVHLAARVLGEAGPGEILVSGAVPALMLGAPVSFESRGRRELRGIPGEWELFAATLDPEEWG